MRKVLLSGVLLPTILAFGWVAFGYLDAWAGEKKGVGMCIVSGNPAKEKFSLNVNGKDVYFCCNGCPKKFQKTVLNVQGEASEKCPISGRPAKEDVSVIQTEAKMVAFCCDRCPKAFAKKNKLEFEDKGAKKCPISGEPAKEANKLVVNGKAVYFCCGGCQKKYVKMLNVQGGDPTECAVSGRGVKDGTEMVFVKSKTVNFCCPNCREKYVAQNIKKTEKI